MQLTINGQSQTHPDGWNVSELLQQLGLGSAVVAVEVNKQLVPRRVHPETILRDQDVVEIVTLVGGG